MSSGERLLSPPELAQLACTDDWKEASMFVSPYTRDRKLAHLACPMVCAPEGDDQPALISFAFSLAYNIPQVFYLVERFRCFLDFVVQLVVAGQSGNFYDTKGLVNLNMNIHIYLRGPPFHWQ